MKNKRAQSFLEFAVVLPILLLILIGVVEMTLFIGRYISLVDLTREAARFASNRDPLKSGVKDNCGVSSDYNFWFDTACVFSPLKGDASCAVGADGKPDDASGRQIDPFCNGFNSSVPIKPAEDDILISVFTESLLPDANGVKVPTLTESDPRLETNPWVWSEHDPDTTHNSNWRRDCNRKTTPAAANREFTPAKLQSYLRTNAMPDKGFVVVEIYYCYHQVLNAPLFSNFVPNPLLIHTYTVMPLPALQPTAVPANP